MKYRVHCYVEVRVPVWVEAESHAEACKKAFLDTDFHQLLNQGDIEFAEDYHGFLVDEEGDEEYNNSRFYDNDVLKEED